MKLLTGRLLATGSALMLATIALVTSSETAPPHSPPPEIEKAILARMNEIQAAAEALDADQVFRFVIEDDAGVIAQNGKLFMTRSNALESTRQSFESLRQAGAHLAYHFDQQHVTLLSPSLALVVGEGTTSVSTADGRNSKTQFAQSVLLLRTNGDWKVFHAHRSFVPPLP